MAESALMESISRTILRSGYDKHSDLEQKPMAEVAQGLFLVLIMSVSTTIWSSYGDCDMTELERSSNEVSSLLEVIGARTINRADYGFYAAYFTQEMHLLKSCNASQTVISEMARETNVRAITGNARAETIRISSTLISRYGAACVGRRMFVSANGKIGMSAWSLKDGDDIWLLAGAKVPFALRPRANGRYELIGEAYVDGVMFGEAWLATEESHVTVTLE